MSEQEWEDKLAEVQKHSEHWYNKYKELENKIADIKANCDLAIEGRDIKIKELEKENAELKKKIGIYQKGMYDEIEKRDRKLTKAKEIIREIMKYEIPTLDYEKAEQFLKEIEE